MFYFPENSKIKENIDLDDLSKLLYGKKLKYIKNYILKIEMQYLIAPETVKLKKGNELEYFYVFRIKLKRPGLPLEFLNRFDMYIQFPVFYCLEYENHENFILPIYCVKNNKKQKPYRILTTGWLPIDDFFTLKYGYRIVKSIDKNIDDIYKNLIIFLCGLRKNGETDFMLEDYVENLKSNYNNDDILRMIFSNNFIYAYRKLHIDIGYPTFNSLIDRFSEYKNNKNKISCLNPFIFKYLSDLNYGQSQLALMGSRKIDNKYVYSFQYILSRKINKGNTSLLKKEITNKIEEIKLPFSLQKSFVAKPINFRDRTDDEVDEMKLIYGKYLAEPYTKEQLEKLQSEEEIEKKKEQRKNNKIERERRNGTRRKLTAEDIEEMKKYSSRKIY